MQSIKYFDKPICIEPPVKTVAIATDFRDSTSFDTLYEDVAASGMLVSYHRRINTGVCFDGKCRLLDITLYWNVTGRYLGFELPDKEFLSKADHEPFTRREYERLHGILADSLSPLADFVFSELASERKDTVAVDGVTSATTKELSEHIVPGAAYTTYRLWHLIYGSVQKIIAERTEKRLSKTMALMILRQGAVSDKIWIANRLNDVKPLDAELQNQVFLLINHQNLNLAERIISALDTEILGESHFQKQLLAAINDSPYSLKKLLIGKLKFIKYVDADVARDLVNMLPKLNGDLIGAILDFFEDKKIAHSFIQEKVSLLLDNSNRYIARKAFEFLLSLTYPEALVKKRMEVYKSKLSDNG